MTTPLSRDDLRRIGNALYGPEWQSPMARDLGHPVQTVQRWASGKRRIPSDLGARLLPLLPGGMARLRERIAELRRIERMMRRAA